MAFPQTTHSTRAVTMADDLCNECEERPKKGGRGPFSGTCGAAECEDAVRKRLSIGQAARHRNGPGNRPPRPVQASVPTSYEQKAKGLVAAGRAVDKAVKKHRAKAKTIEPLKRDVEAALKEWRDTLRRIADTE